MYTISPIIIESALYNHIRIFYLHATGILSKINRYVIGSGKNLFDKYRRLYHVWLECFVTDEKAPVPLA